MGLNIQNLAVASPDLEAHSAIDPRFAADTGNETPVITISGVPDGTVELALVMHDPDAPLPNGFTHWTVYGIDPSLDAVDGSLDAGYRFGANGMGEFAYSGPQPPAGHGTHHYYFWVYALDAKVSGTPNREEFLATYGGNILEQNRLVATYQR